MRIEFTDHAVERYMQYYDDSPVLYAEAKIRLTESAVGARRLKERTIRGDHLWLVENLGVTIVTKCETGSDGLCHVCVTVLPPAELRSLGASSIERIQHKLAEIRDSEYTLRAEQEAVKATDAERLREQQAAKSAAKQNPKLTQQAKEIEAKRSRAEVALRHQRALEGMKVRSRMLTEEREILVAILSAHQKAVRIQQEAVSAAARKRVGYEQAFRIAMRFIRKLPSETTIEVLSTIDAILQAPTNPPSEGNGSDAA